MVDLLVLRDEIDKIDRQIVELYETRMEVCKQVAEYKIETGKPVFDKEREDSKIQTLKALAKNEFNSQGVKELFEQIMSISRKLQYGLLAEHGVIGELPFTEVESLPEKDVKVVFQGAEGAYAQIAMEEYFGKNVNSYHVDTWRDAMEEIAKGEADYGVLPIENSSAGVVSEMYDLLVEFENYIVAEQIIGIEHCLMGIPGTKIEDIKTVYSHPQSLMQSSMYLNEHRNWKQYSMKNNAFATKKVMEDGDATQAAIASEHAANTYGLDILEKGINDNKNNSTRFIIVTNKKIFTRDAKKVSICFEIPHESGSLYHMLSHFIYNNLNLTKIESRPIPGKNWEYRFFVDFEGNFNDNAVKNALRGLAEEATHMRILGNYK